jgi:DNA invertase Pin-like site-specific DNA recombinase
LVHRNIRVIILKQNLDIAKHDMNSKIVITLFSLFAELERDLISLRTKEALNAKRLQGVTLGKPKGTIQKSKFDIDGERIKELLKLGLSVRKITKLLGYTNHIALNTYINKRNLRVA